jgi:hypothetical protein
MEVHRVVRHRGSHIFYTIGSRMAARLRKSISVTNGTEEKDTLKDIIGMARLRGSARSK